MTIHNLSATDAHTSEEAHDLQTLLFIDLHTSLGAEPEDIPEAERLSESDTTIFTLTCTRKMLSLLSLTVSVSP